MYRVSIEFLKHEWKFGGARNAVGTQAVGECEKTVSGNTHLQLMFPQHFLFSQTSTHVSIKQLDYELEISIA